MLKFMCVTITTCLLNFAIKKKHALTLLLQLELLNLLIILVILYIGVEIFFCMLMVCVRACEGAVGLGALIRIIRAKKNQIIVN